MSKELQELVERADKAKNDSVYFMNEILRTYEHVAPSQWLNRSTQPGVNSGTQTPAGSNRNQSGRNRMIMREAEHSADRFSGRTHQRLMPTDQPFFTIVPGEAAKKDLGKLADAAATRLTERMQKIIMASNLPDAAPKFFKEFAVTAAYVEPRVDPYHHNRLRFDAHRASDFALEADSSGEIVAIYRFFEATQRELEMVFGNDAPAPSKNAKEDEKIEIVHTIIRKPLLEGWHTSIIAKSKDSGQNKYKLMRKEVSSNPPVIVGQWMKEAGDTYARGPAMRIVESSIALNRTIERYLSGVAIRLQPPYQMDPSAHPSPETILFVPNGIIPVDISTGGLNPLQFPNMPPDVQLLVQMFTTQIRSGLFDDRLPEYAEPSTAAEVNFRAQELQNDELGGFARATEFVINLISRCVEIAMKEGWLDKDDDGKEDGTMAALAGSFEVMVNGPIAQERLLGKARYMMDAKNAVNTFSPGAGEIMYKVDEFARLYNEAYGLGEDEVHSDDEIEQTLDEVQQRGMEMLAEVRAQAFQEQIQKQAQQQAQQPQPAQSPQFLGQPVA